MMRTPVLVGPANFQREVLRAEQPVVVDFFVPSCMECRRLEWVVHHLVHAFHDQAGSSCSNILPRGANRCQPRFNLCGDVVVTVSSHCEPLWNRPAATGALEDRPCGKHVGHAEQRAQFWLLLQEMLKRQSAGREP